MDRITSRGFILNSAAAAALVGVGLGMFLWKQKIRREEYRRVGRVARLFIYPIKSCKGIEVSAADCTPLGIANGLAKDRQFLVVDENGRFLTARQEPSMLLITPSYHGDEMWIDAPEMPTLKIKLLPEQDNRPIISCQVWGEHISGRDCGEEASDWFSKFLKLSGYKLVQFTPDLQARRIGEGRKKEHPFNKLGDHDQAVYTDLAPYLMMTEPSNQDLNTRLNKPVSIINFRPCIVVDQCAAYEEDTWDKIKIGQDILMRNFKPCDRCTLTTIDPETGIKDKNIEPLKTLRSYRQTKNTKARKYLKDNPILGINLAVDRCGRINVGDDVFATFMTSPLV